MGEMAEDEERRAHEVATLLDMWDRTVGWVEAMRNSMRALAEDNPTRSRSELVEHFLPMQEEVMRSVMGPDGVRRKAFPMLSNLLMMMVPALIAGDRRDLAGLMRPLIQGLRDGAIEDMGVDLVKEVEDELRKG